jgi:NYN domain
MMRQYRFSVLKVKDNDQDFFRDDDLEDEEEYTVDYTKFESFFDDNHHLDEQIDYGKFERDSKMLEDEQEESPLLPKFLTHDNHDDDDDDDDGYSDDETQTTWTTQLSSTEKMMQRRMEEQQQQIDLLMKLVQHQQQQPLVAPPLPSFETLPSSATTSIITPLRAMLFIDGTWLYYSIHERNEQKCPIIHKYGRGWQTRYQFDWTALSRVICEQLRLQETLRHQQRHVEITRSSVYTSCKRDTSRYSNRVRMFQDMQAANYDVFMMETVGPGEKCVDIQLAVEMLHYATTANAYDVAILLSGDKDFLPALLRIRQKGRKVAIVAFRNGCNRALYETPNVKDYDMIWMDDFLDQLIIPKTTTTTGGGTAQQVSIFTITKVIHDFIDKSGLPRVSSRDIGRYLKLKKVNQRSLLDELKKSYGGLYQFLTVSGCFYVVRRNERDSKAAQRIDTTDKTFW